MCLKLTVSDIYASEKFSEVEENYVQPISYQLLSRTLDEYCSNTINFEYITTDRFFCSALNLIFVETDKHNFHLSFRNFQPASYGKKNGVWYGAPSGGGGQGWGGRNTSRKPSVVETDLPAPGAKPGAGRVIRIINNMDHSVQVSYFIFFVRKYM